MSSLSILSKNTILVTGAAGFIGYHTSKKILEDGGTVIGLDNLNDYYDPAIKKQRLNLLKKYKKFVFKKADISNEKALAKVFDENKFDYVINLAGEAGVRDSITSPHKHLKTNVIGFFNILENLRRANTIKNTVYASTSAVYGNNETPFHEQQDITKPVSMYGASKTCNELMAYTYHTNYKIPLIGLRFFTVYGPKYRPDMAVQRFYDGIMSGQPIDVYNYGKNMRDFVYVDDVVDGILSALTCPELSPNVYNIGSDKSISTLDLIKIIEKETEKSAQMRFMAAQPGDPLKTEVDITAAKSDLGFDPKTSIEEGIRKFVASLKD